MAAWSNWLWNYDGKSVDIKGSIDKPYFNSKQIAKILGYADENKAIRDNVDDEDRRISRQHYQSWCPAQCTTITKEKPSKIVECPGEFCPDPLSYNDGKTVYILEAARSPQLGGHIISITRQMFFCLLMVFSMPSSESLEKEVKRNVF